MIKAVCMFKLADNVDEEEFEKFFSKHVEDAKKLKNLKKYTISKRVSGDRDYYRINELYYDKIEDAEESFSTNLAKQGTEELMRWVKDFKCIITEEKNIV